VIVSLGAVFPSRPRTAEGTIVASEAAAVAAAVLTRKSRREVLLDGVLLDGDIGKCLYWFTASAGRHYF
jgi:hypothetical protein